MVTTITFMNISNLEKFFKTINACEGGVFFETSDGRYVDVRRNGLVQKLLESSCGEHGVAELPLHVTSDADSDRLIQYLIGSYC